MTANIASPLLPLLRVALLGSAMFMVLGTPPAAAQFLCTNFNTGDAGFSTAPGSNFACGFNNTAGGNGSVNTVVGLYSNAAGDFSHNVATGYFADAGGPGANNIATGAFSNATGNGSTNIATGYLADASGGDDAGNIATGNHANASGTASKNVAIGDRANASGNGTNNTAIGAGASASNGGAAFGSASAATGTGATAVGPNATAAFANSSAFGNGATATRDNQQVLGTASNTYTMSGITSGASKAAQSGPVQVVTSDANGNLATSTLAGLGLVSTGDVNTINAQLGDINNRISTLTTEVRRGIAATAALAPVIMPSAPGRTTFSLSSGFYHGQAGAGFGFARLNLSTPLVLHGSYSNGGGSEHVGRVGMAVEF